jgi:hypothetical protein
MHVVTESYEPCYFVPGPDGRPTVQTYPGYSFQPGASLAMPPGMQLMPHTVPVAHQAARTPHVIIEDSGPLPVARSGPLATQHEAEALSNPGPSSGAGSAPMQSNAAERTICRLTKKPHPCAAKPITIGRASSSAAEQPSATATNIRQVAGASSNDQPQAGPDAGVAINTCLQPEGTQPSHQITTSDAEAGQVCAQPATDKPETILATAGCRKHAITVPLANSLDMPTDAIFEQVYAMKYVPMLSCLVPCENQVPRCACNPAAGYVAVTQYLTWPTAWRHVTVHRNVAGLCGLGMPLLTRLHACQRICHKQTQLKAR